MIYDTVIGIDPGKNGWVAIHRNGSIGVSKLEFDQRKFKQFLKHYTGISKRLIIYIEKIDFHDMRNPAVIRQMKKLSDHYAGLITVLKTENINFIEVHPRTWQARFGLSKKGIKGHEKKRMHRDFLCSTLKHPKISIERADAVLILKYGLTQIKTNIAINEPLTMKLCTETKKGRK